MIIHLKKKMKIKIQYNIGETKSQKMVDFCQTKCDIKFYNYR